jgi:Protein of unknown function (DUF4238)
MSKEGRHHYIPVFYLKQWARDSKGRFCEFSRPYDRVKPRRTHPDGTGYVDGLNTIEGLPAADSRYLEDVFFQIADDGAAQALKTLLGPPPWSMSAKERSAWTRFIMSLLVRNPEGVAKYKQVAAAIYKAMLPRNEALYAKERGPDDPPTYAAYAERHGPNPAARIVVRVIQTLSDNEELGRQINAMRWTVLSFKGPKFELLTSDRPMLMTNGIGTPTGHLIMPISPFHIFVATNNIETELNIRNVSRNGKAIAQINDRVALQSRKYVWGTDDTQLTFVARRLGHAITADPMEAMSIEKLVDSALAALSPISR